MSSPRAAFTLLEICLTLVIGVVLILLAVPSVRGLFAEQRLRESFTRFEQMADAARLRSLRDQKPCLLSWQRDGIALLSSERDKHGDPLVIDRLGFSKDEDFQLERPAALVEKDKPVAEWIFWPNGICEPVVVSYKGPAGRWQVRFDPLTAHGTFLSSDTL